MCRNDVWEGRRVTKMAMSCSAACDLAALKSTPFTSVAPSASPIRIADASGGVVADGAPLGPCRGPPGTPAVGVWVPAHPGRASGGEERRVVALAGRTVTEGDAVLGGAHVVDLHGWASHQRVRLVVTASREAQAGVNSEQAQPPSQAMRPARLVRDVVNGRIE